MFKWFKRILGYGSIAEGYTEVTPEPKAKIATKKVTPKKTSTKKKGSGSCDFDKLNKTQLLKEAKKRGVKANASLT